LLARIGSRAAVASASAAARREAPATALTPKYNPQRVQARAEIGRQSKNRNLKSKILIAVVALAAIGNAAWWHPYGIAYFNQALGGAPLGARMFLAGWGEGFEQVADWLNRQPDITGVVTVS